jgi:Legume lectin domain
VGGDPQGDWPGRAGRGIGVAAVLIALGALLCQTAAAKVPVNFPNFSRTAGLSLNGDAAKAGKRLRLTPAAASMTGGAFTNRKVVNPAKSFTTSFRFSLHDAIVPGDGMAFVLTTRGRKALGFGAGGLGYSGLAPSIAIEFDKFLNPEAHDPDDNHVAVTKDGNTGAHLAKATPSFDLYGGTRWVWITYSARKKTLRVYVNDSKRKPRRPLVKFRRKLADILHGQSARAGFTAATGGAYMAADILSWKLSRPR